MSRYLIRTADVPGYHPANHTGTTNRRLIGPETVGAKQVEMLLGVIESLASGYIGDLSGGVFGSNYRDIFAFLVLVAVLVLRPSGLLGQHSGDRA